MSAHNFSNITSVLAVYGSLLASFTFGWTLYRDLRDRARIKLSAQVRRIGMREDGSFFMMEPSQEIAGVPKQLFLVISVVNVGRRPLRWSGVGGNYKTPVNGKGGFVLSPRYLPKMLEEQEAHDEYTELTSPFIEENIKRMYIWDAAGRKWNVSRRDIKQIAKDGKKTAIISSYFAR
jgi:hypothetical protein